MIKRIGLILWLALIAITVDAQDTLTVMSYNIYHGEQAYAEGENNLDDIAALIKKVRPDLVALQEVDSLTGRSGKLVKGSPVNQVQYLANKTGMHGYFGKAMAYDGGGYGEALLSGKQLESNKIILPIPEGGEPRALLMVNYPLRDGRNLIFGGTHLCHQFEDNRVAQMQAINNYFGSLNQPAIVAGDLNFTPESAPYSFIVDDWADAAKRSGTVEPTFSFHKPDKRIDYIFLSKNTNWEIIEMEVLQVNHSDHMPVVLQVVVP